MSFRPPYRVGDVVTWGARSAPGVFLNYTGVVTDIIEPGDPIPDGVEVQAGDVGECRPVVRVADGTHYAPDPRRVLLAARERAVQLATPHAGDVVALDLRPDGLHVRLNGTELQRVRRVVFEATPDNPPVLQLELVGFTLEHTSYLATLASRPLDPPEPA